MARPKKAGLDFYYREVDEMDDYRRMLLMDRYGPTGCTVFDIVIDRIYKNGYYLEMPLDYLSAQIMRVIGGKWIEDKEHITEIIRYCGEIDLFSKELLAMSVITSEDIQRNYSYVSARRKADRSKYWLLPVQEESVNGDENSHADEKHVIATETCSNPPQTHVIATEIRSNSPQTHVIATDATINAAIIPQSREDKSRANQTKENEMRAEQSREEQKTRKSADEIFYERGNDYSAANAGYEDSYAAANAGYEDSYAAANAGYEDFHAAANAEYEDFYAAANAEYGEIDNAYYAAAGRHLGKYDRETIDILRREGADNSLIISVIGKVASRCGAKKIHSFRYFMPAIRERLNEKCGTFPSGGRDAWANSDNYIHNGFDPDGPYAGCTTTEEYITALNREFGLEPGGKTSSTQQEDIFPY